MTDEQLTAFNKVFGDMALSNSDTAHVVFQYGWEAGQRALLYPAVEAPPEAETEAEKQAYAFGWFKAMEFMRRGK